MKYSTTQRKRRILMQNNRAAFALLMLAMLMGWSACKTPDKIFAKEDYSLPEKYTVVEDTAHRVPASFGTIFHDATLTAIINLALAGNFDVRLAQQRVEMARSNVLLKKSALAPVVGLNTFGSNTKYGRYTMDGEGNFTTPGVPYPIVPSYMLGVSSSWEIDVWGKLRNRKKAAQYRYLSSEMGRNLVITGLVSEIAYRYFELISYDDKLKIINKNIKLQQDALEIVAIQKEAGKATSLAVKQFEAQLMHTQSLEYEVKQDILRVENEINLLVGRQPQEIKRKASVLNAKLPDTKHPGIPSDLLYNRPDIIQAEMELKATKADVAAARAAFLPSFTLSAHAGYNTYHPWLLFDPLSIAYGLVANVAGPLVNRKAYKAEYAMAIASNQTAYNDYAKSALKALYEVRTNLGSIENTGAQYELNEKEASTLKEAIAISTELYVAGYANYLEVIMAQRNAMEAELNAVITRKNVFFSYVNLYRSLGGGWR